MKSVYPVDAPTIAALNNGRQKTYHVPEECEGSDVSTNGSFFRQRLFLYFICICCQQLTTSQLALFVRTHIVPKSHELCDDAAEPTHK